jgi:hypothetical protein
MIIHIPCIDWNVDMVVFFLEGSKSRYDLSFLIRQKEGFLWVKLDLILVFVWHFPFIHEWDATLILDEYLLLAGDALVDGWEEQLLVVAQDQVGLVAVTNQINLVNIRRVMVVNELSCKVEVTWLLWSELEADDGEALTCNEANRRVRVECLGTILQDLEVCWSVTCVCDLYCLVNRFVWTA